MVELSTGHVSHDKHDNDSRVTVQNYKYKCKVTKQIKFEITFAVCVYCA